MKLAFPFFSLSCLLLMAPAYGQEFRSYVGETNAVWESPTNWNPNLVPDSITEGARLDNGATVNVGGSHTISALEIRGGSLTMNQNNTLRTSTLLIDSAGTIAGPGTLVITQAGRFSDVSGVTFSNVTFRNEGNFELFFGMALAPEAVFQNVNTTSFVDGSFIGIAGGGVGEPGRIENTGFLRKTAGTGTATIGRAIDNDLEIVSLAGNFAITGDVDSSGQFRTEGDGRITLSGNNIMSDGARIFGDGLTRMTTGTLTVPADAAVSVDHFLADGGQIINEGTMNYQGGETFWNSAFITGAGTTRIQSGAILTIEDSPTATTLTGSQSVEIEAGGSLIFEGNTSNLSTNSAISLVNRGTIEFAGDGNIFQNGSGPASLMTLRNEAGGRIVKSGAGSDDTDIVAKVVSLGEFTVEAGDVTLFREADFSAPLEVLSGATVSFRGSSQTPSILRSGTRLFGGGDVIFRTPVEVPAGVVVEANRLELESGSGLQGAGTLRILESGEWKSGNLVDQVTLEVAPSATMILAGTGSRSIASGSKPTILNRGLFSIGDTANLSSNGSGRFENEGTLILTEAGRFGTNSGTNLIFENTGTIIKEAGSVAGNNARSIFPVDLRHQGVLEVRSGILDLFGEHEISAPIMVQDGAVLRLDGNESTTFLAGGSVVGEGSLEHKGSDIVIPAGVRTLFSNYSTPLGGGEVRGAGTFVFSGDAAITRFNHIGPGVTEIAPGATVEITPGSFQLADGRVLHVRGTLDFPGRFSSTTSNGMTLKNEGLITFRDGSTWNHGGGQCLMENPGTIRIEAPSGQTVSFALDKMTGNGLIDVISGRLRFSRAVDIPGTIRLAAGTQLSGSGLSFGSGSTVSGVGTINGPVTLQGTVAPGLSIGTLNVSSSTTFTSSGSLAVELGDGVSDQFTVASTLDLGGLTILPGPVAGYTPAAGDSWVIATANSITGSVGLVSQAAAAPGFGYFLTQSGNELVLTYSAVESFQDAIEAATGLSLGVDPDLTAFATGDLDGDGVQDLTDWAFGGSLGGADPGRSLRIDSVLQTSPTTRELAIAFPIRSLMGDVTISLESDPDLDGVFSQVTFAPAGTEVRDGILFQTATVEMPLSASTNFLRVRVELN